MGSKASVPRTYVERWIERACSEFPWLRCGLAELDEECGFADEEVARLSARCFLESVSRGMDLAGSPSRFDKTANVCAVRRWESSKRVYDVDRAFLEEMSQVRPDDVPADALRALPSSAVYLRCPDEGREKNEISIGGRAVEWRTLTEGFLVALVEGRVVVCCFYRLVDALFSGEAARETEDPSSIFVWRDVFDLRGCKTVADALAHDADFAFGTVDWDADGGDGEDVDVVIVETPGRLSGGLEDFEAVDEATLGTVLVAAAYIACNEDEFEVAFDPAKARESLSAKRSKRKRQEKELARATGAVVFRRKAASDAGRAAREDRMPQG